MTLEQQIKWLEVHISTCVPESNVYKYGTEILKTLKELQSGKET